MFHFEKKIPKPDTLLLLIFRDNVFLYLDLDVAAEDLVLADKAGVKKHPYVGSLRPIGKNLMLSRSEVQRFPTFSDAQTTLRSP